VEHAGDGEEALARVRQNNYDVVICDLKMPRVDGMTLYRAIAAGRPSLARRVIFVTGDVAGPDAQRFLEESGCRWLAKPFRLGDLLRNVRERPRSSTTPGLSVFSSLAAQRCSAWPSPSSASLKRGSRCASAALPRLHHRIEGVAEARIARACNCETRIHRRRRANLFIVASP
jgi:CheY-like chemotaxis protein